MTTPEEVSPTFVPFSRIDGIENKGLAKSLRNLEMFIAKNESSLSILVTKAFTQNNEGILDQAENRGMVT